MLTKRTLLLTLTGLLIGYAATAQSATPATAGPQLNDVLSWVTWGAAAVVLLFGMITTVSLASATAQRAQLPDETPAATPIALPASETVPAATTEQKVAA